jgi:aspartate/glutamate racemase
MTANEAQEAIQKVVKELRDNGFDEVILACTYSVDEKQTQCAMYIHGTSEFVTSTICQLVEEAGSRMMDADEVLKEIADKATVQ